MSEILQLPLTLQIFNKGLTFVNSCDTKVVESLLETILHLIHICSLEQTINIDKYGSFFDRFMNWSEEFGASIADLLYKILLAEEFKFSHTKIRSIFKIFNQKYPSFIPTLKARRSEFDISKSICRLMTPIVKMSLVRKTYCQRTPGQVDGQFKSSSRCFLKINLRRLHVVVIQKWKSWTTTRHGNSQSITVCCVKMQPKMLVHLE